MLFIISPSKTQQIEVPLHGNYSQPLFPEQTCALVQYIKALDEVQLASLLKTSEKLTALNYQRYQQFQTPFTPKNSRQALCMFQGDQFNPLAVEEYSEQQLSHAQHHLRILSGLYGMLRPLDLMQLYRLEMATRLEISGAKTLYQFWGERVTAQLKRELDQDSVPVLINLASVEYFKVIHQKELQHDVLTISFKQKKAGKVKTIAIYAKRARGEMVDFVIQNGLTRPDELRDFNREGYAFDAETSTDNNWLFVKELK